MSKQVLESISVFSQEIKNLFWATEISAQTNVFIGGSSALVLHGVITPKNPGDLDIVIYKPTDKQIEIVLELMKPDLEYQPEEYDKFPSKETKIRSFKLHKDGYSLNVILERKKEIPETHLAFISQQSLAGLGGFGLITLPITPINIIIQAKASYRDKTGKYARIKDVFYMQQLKALNFNFE